ncbi:transglycosylase SLT domain-containing protein [Streptomyces xiaopingdaonensis]|uniref:transglycosylase SLT domain-containing protein n=1 Tax=Streptomyces xiaopingdaonensis TaxID=1565415 RepID=UPI00030F2B27|nr:transglycosylase SLT domain-containing protein [Streptomyces xiaopingdaonensis]
MLNATTFLNRPSKLRTYSAAGVVTAGTTAALVMAAAPAASAQGAPSDQGPKKVVSQQDGSVAKVADVDSDKALAIPGQRAHGGDPTNADAQGSILSSAGQAGGEDGSTKTGAEGTKGNDAAEKADDRAKDGAASRSAERSQPKKYSNNLDGWIKEARDVMKKNDIPGSYDGIKRNIIRESAGDPKAINDWDVNAKNGVPSKGLLQVIQPTFDAYHVKGTEKDLYDPVANIVAACNYAADKYGSMDNVDSAY